MSTRNDLEKEKFVLNASGEVCWDLDTSSVPSPVGDLDLDDLEKKKFTGAGKIRSINTF